MVYFKLISQKLSPELKIGHCGTLDPMATGILIVCLNQMTRFASYLSSSEKTYHACIYFGKKTSTGDSEGEIIDSKEFSFLDFSSKDVENTIQKFLGKSKQKPPAYSALKHKGKSLYEYARKGITIEKDESEIFISSISSIVKFIRAATPDIANLATPTNSAKAGICSDISNFLLK